MTSDMTWQARGVRAQPLEAAREAARRSGMSVGEWLDSVILESARQEGVTPGGRPDDNRYSETRASPQHREENGYTSGEQFAEVNARLDTLSRQLERLASAPAPDAGKGRWDSQVSRQLTGALSQFDRRLDKTIVERTPAESERRSPRRTAAPEPQALRPSAVAPVRPLDQALAEIAERQRVLDSEPARPDLPRAPTQGLGGLKQQLRSINSQAESHKACPIDGAVETLRDTLVEIGQMIREAMPRQAIEALETEVRSLAQRIDSKRDASTDTPDLAGLEHGLAEVRDALRALAPAESLVEFESTVRAMSEKIDSIAAIAQDPTALEHLEGAIAGLRGVASHVASNEALAKLSDEVRTLAVKVEQVASSDILATLEQRIAFIADALQSRPQPDRDVRDLEALMQGLADKIERLQLASAGHPNGSRIDEQIAQLIEKIESSEVRFGQLDNIERGLAELLLQIDRQPGSQQVTGEPALQPEFDTLKRDVQRTHESVEAVHGTLGQVVDRLVVIETELRGATVAPQPAPIETLAPASPGLAPIAQEVPSAANAAPLLATGHGNPAIPAERRPIDPNLPPDHPLEPGADCRSNTPADRIAASEAALGAGLGANPGALREPAASKADAKANFIAAARRAAQAASTQLGGRGDRRATEQQRHPWTGPQPDNARAGGYARMLLIAASVVMIVLGSLQLVTGLFNGSAGKIAVAPDEPTASTPVNDTPVKMEPTLARPPGRQSDLLPVHPAITAPSAGVLAPPEPFAPAVIPAIPGTATTLERLITGTVRQPSPPPPPAPAGPHAPAQSTDATSRLPASMGAGLRAAAAKGDPAAEFEVAVRYAEGRGTPQNFAAAAEWFERAAKQGLTPAQFRLGGLYEKGMGVKKDLDAARRLYIAAAQAGNAKAMHNLAVLYAEGADGKPDYQTAAIWFRKAADHGVIDSQYNLGILYARGIGVETNLAEAYKWFALAARDGDRDSAKKRDELGLRLDQATAAAAYAAVRSWTAEPQPDAAIRVRMPPGGWEGGPSPSTAKRRVSSDATSQRATP